MAAMSLYYTDMAGDYRPEKKEQTIFAVEKVVPKRDKKSGALKGARLGGRYHHKDNLNTRSYDDDSGQRHWIMEVVVDIVADPKWGEGAASSGGSYSGGYSKGSGGASNGYGNNSGGFNQFGPSKPEQREESMFPAKGP